jgi:hypothetical protein
VRGGSRPPPPREHRRDRGSEPRGTPLPPPGRRRQWSMSRRQRKKGRSLENCHACHEARWGRSVPQLACGASYEDRTRHRIELGHDPRVELRPGAAS